MAEETYDEVNTKTKDEVVKNELSTIDEQEAIETYEIIVEIKEAAGTLPVQPAEKVALKKQPSCRAKLMDKLTCPKCGNELSRHNYDYTHSKFCKGIARKPLVATDDDRENEEITKKI